MSTYPVLNGRPIDQWNFGELKEELCRRNLPIEGLKDDLVKRLFEDLQGDILGGQEPAGGSPPSDDLKEDEAPGSADASVCQAVTEQNIDEAPADATADISQDVSQTTPVAATEVTDAPPVDVATADKICPSDAVATKRDHQESAPNGSTVVKEASPQADRHSEIIAEKSPEEGTIKKVIVNDPLCDVASTDLKLDAFSAKGKLDADIVEQDAVSSPPDAIASHVDPLDVDAVAGAPGQNAETLIPKIDSGDNALVSVKDQEDSDVDAVASAPGQNAETLNPKIDSGDNALVNVKDQEDSGCTNSPPKPTLSGTKDQVSEDNPVLGSQIKRVSRENVSTNVKGDLIADSSDMKIEAKRDMVKSPCNIPSTGDGLQALDDDKELSKNGTLLQEIESETNMNLDKQKDSPNGASPDKLNLDGSSGNELMEEDVMESMHVDPNIRSDDLGKKTAVTSDHEEVKEVILLDTVAKDSSGQTMGIVADEKPVTPSEKRKPEDQEVVADEPIKRQRRVHTLKISKQQLSDLSSSDSPKVVVGPALKHSVDRSDSTASGDSHKERIVPLSQKPATTSLRVDRFLRPFTLKAVQELLGRTGSVCSFWMDDIKTHCYVTYSSVDEAVATRNSVYNLQWPPNNGSCLAAEFVDPHEVKLIIEHPPPPPAPAILSNDTAPKIVAFQQANANQTMLPHGAGISRGLPPTPQPRTNLFPTSNPVSEREMLPPPPKEPETTIMTLDNLFKKTQAYPMIYYLPLSEEEVSAKLAARRRQRRGW